MPATGIGLQPQTRITVIIKDGGGKGNEEICAALGLLYLLRGSRLMPERVLLLMMACFAPFYLFAIPPMSAPGETAHPQADGRIFYPGSL